MNCNLFTSMEQPSIGVRHQRAGQAVLCNSGRCCPLSLINFIHSLNDDPPFCIQESIVLLLHAGWRKRRFPFPCPACQSMGRPNQFRLGRENLGRMDTCAHISHSSLSNLQIRYWEIFFWSMLTKFVLTVFICRGRWVSYMISLPTGQVTEKF